MLNGGGEVSLSNLIDIIIYLNGEPFVRSPVIYFSIKFARVGKCEGNGVDVTESKVVAATSSRYGS